MSEWQKQLHKLAEEKGWGDKELSELYLIVSLVQADIKEKIIKQILNS